MNYLWEILQEQKKNGLKSSNIRFKQSEAFCAYTELVNTGIFGTSNQNNIEFNDVNIYYRFTEIFSSYIKNIVNQKIDKNKYHWFINQTLHFLGQCDLKSGVTHNRLIYKIIVTNLENGFFGENIVSPLQSLSYNDKELLAKHLKRLYDGINQLEVFKNAIGDLFSSYKLYLQSEPSKYILYLPVKNEIHSCRNKFNIIKHLFWDISYDIDLVTGNHFGIIDVSDKMLIDNIGIY